MGNPIPSRDALKPCPFCGKEPVRISIGTASCDGMVNGKEVHNTIGMRPECWNARALSDQPDSSNEGLAELLRMKTGYDLEKAAVKAADRIKAQAARIAELEGALEEVRQWAEAYPAQRFPEPDMRAVTHALTDAGLRNQIDRMHASWARHLIDGVGKIARTALRGGTQA